MRNQVKSLPAAALAALLAVVASAPVGAGGGLVYELKGGLLAHDVPALWSNFQLERNAVDVNLEVMFTPAFAFLGGAIRPAVGGNLNTKGDTSNAYIDARWQYETPWGLYFGLGLGAAVHDGHTGPDQPTRKALGSRALFHIPAEIGYRFDTHNSLSIYFEHMSNAYTQDYNEGMDRLGVRYGYRF